MQMQLGIVSDVQQIPPSQLVLTTSPGLLHLKHNRPPPPYQRSQQSNHSGQHAPSIPINHDCYPICLHQGMGQDKGRHRRRLRSSLVRDGHHVAGSGAFLRYMG